MHSHHVHIFCGFTLPYSSLLIATTTLLAACATVWLDWQSSHERIVGDIIISPVQPAPAVFEAAAPWIITVLSICIQSACVVCAHNICTRGGLRHNRQQVGKRYHAIISMLFPFDPHAGCILLSGFRPMFLDHPNPWLELPSRSNIPRGAAWGNIILVYKTTWIFFFIEPDIHGKPHIYSDSRLSPLSQNFFWTFFHAIQEIFEKNNKKKTNNKYCVSVHDLYKDDRTKLVVLPETYGLVYKMWYKTVMFNTIQYGR